MSKNCCGQNVILCEAHCQKSSFKFPKWLELSKKNYNGSKFSGKLTIFFKIVFIKEERTLLEKTKIKNTHTVAQ